MEGEKDIVNDGIYLHGIGKWYNLYVEGRRSIKEGLYFEIKTLTGLRGDFEGGGLIAMGFRIFRVFLYVMKNYI